MTIRKYRPGREPNRVKKLLKGRVKVEIKADGSHHHKCVHCPREWKCYQWLLPVEAKECSRDSVCDRCLEKYSRYTLKELREHLPL